MFWKPPKEARANKVWKLNTTVHGLCDTPRAFYLNLEEDLINSGDKCRYDDIIFFWHNNQLLQSILSSHVDDFIWSGTERFQKNSIDHIRKKFAISKEENQAFRYLGKYSSRKDRNLSTWVIPCKLNRRSPGDPLRFC